MLHKTCSRFGFKLRNISLLAVVCLCVALTASVAQAQKAKPKTANATAAAPRAEDEPCFREYRGVQIGMSIDEARQKLGTPKEQADELDLYSFSDKESAQVYYDKSTKKVTAVSVDYAGGVGAPECKVVVGSDVEARSDGSKFKMMRYPKAGYWVSYNRTAGDTPIVTVTMQKIQ